VIADETGLIEAFLAALPDAGVKLSGAFPGSGDDCALLRLPPDGELAISTDMFVEDVHFPASLPAWATGARCLAAALSDLAAAGAAPRGFTLAIAMPGADEEWLSGLAAGCGRVMTALGVPILGGDLVEGVARTLCVTVLGVLPVGRALLRSGARPGDSIFVSGTLGDAAAGLARFTGRPAGATAGLHDCPPPSHPDFLLWRFFCPTPRIALGCRLATFAHSAIDISDGLEMDLRRILDASGVGARIDPLLLPRSAALRQVAGDEGIAMALGGGDDYELCFTLAPQHEARAMQAGRDCGVALTRIGVIESAAGLRFAGDFRRPSGTGGYAHFSRRRQ